jgi:outer membrane protein
MPLLSKAQTNEGQWLIGAQVGNITYLKQESGYRTMAGSLTPLAGYFVVRGLVVGTGIPVSFSATKYNDYTPPGFDNLRQNSASFGLAPFVRYYIGQGKLKPFVGLAYSYSRSSSKYKTDTAGGSQSKALGYATTLTPSVGLAYFVTPALGLTAALNYNRSHTAFNTVQTSPYTPGASSGNTYSNTLSLSIGFALFLGR